MYSIIFQFAIIVGAFCQDNTSCSDLIGTYYGFDFEADPIFVEESNYKLNHFYGSRNGNSLGYRSLDDYDEHGVYKIHSYRMHLNNQSVKIHTPLVTPNGPNQVANKLYFWGDVIVENGSNLVIEAANNSIEFKGNVIISDNSNLIVKAKTVSFDVISGRDVNIVNSSSCRIYTQEDIVFLSRDHSTLADINCGDGTVSDDSYLKWLANDDIYIEGNVQFFRSRSKSHFEYYARGFIVYASKFEVLADRVELNDEWVILPVDDSGKKIYPHIIGTDRLATVRNPSLSMKLLFQGDLKFKSEIEINPISLYESIFKPDDIDIPEVDGQDVSPNYCDVYWTNWNYDYSYSTPPARQVQNRSLESVPESELPSSPIIVPNPASDQLSVSLRNASSEVSELYIFDLNGNIVFKDTHYQGSRQISVDELVPGYYLVKVYNSGNVFHDILIVQR